MWGRLKTLVLAAVVGAAALVPLFGDPRSTPVTHALWGRMLLRSLDMTDAVRASTQASQVFAALAWRDSLSYTVDRYLRAEGAVVREERWKTAWCISTSSSENSWVRTLVIDSRQTKGKNGGQGRHSFCSRNTEK